MAVDPKILETIAIELEPIDKVKFLDDLRKERIGDLADKNLTEFDIWLKIMSDKAVDPECSVTELGRVATKLAKTAKWISGCQIKMLDYLDRDIVIR